jgi:hypothetical protein
VFTMHTAAERPDLWERGIPSASVWPEYNMHGFLNLWWERLDQDLADFQFVLYDAANDAVVAEGHTGPFWWDGSDETLPDGIDATIERIFRQHVAGEPVNTLCALAAESPRDGRRRGLAVSVLIGMRTVGQRHGLTHLVAPVRPSMKDRHPLTNIERYVRWRREDGQLLDPWMRVHERLGARLATRCPDPCGSPGPSRSGSPGRGWHSRNRATTSSPKAWPPFTLTGKPAPDPTGNRTCGWSTPTFILENHPAYPNRASLW